MPAGPDSDSGGQDRSRSPARGRKSRPAGGDEQSHSSSKPGLLERIPPQDVEAEVATLGSMLFDPEAAGIAAEQLEASDFYRTSHQILFTAICEIYDAGQRPDTVLLRELLVKQGKLDLVGGTDYVASLMTSTPSAANLERYAQIVKEKAIVRSLLEACTSTLREAESGGDVREILDKAEQRIFNVASKRGTGDVVHIKDILKQEFEALLKRRETPGLMTGIPTSFTELDELTGGFQKSDFIILAARPSVGKTALALNLVRHMACVEGKAALVYSLEMSKQQVGLRLLCAHCSLDYRKLRGGFVGDDALNDIINHGMGPLREAPIFIDDTPGIGIMELRAKARRLKAHHDIAIVVVDYIQLMRGPREDNREREVAIISGGLKALARELDLPVLALSQIRRAAEERAGGRPQLADLRESGSLEQDADMVMILHRDRNEDGSWSSDTTLTIAKQRNGPTGAIGLFYKQDNMRFAAKRLNE
jgi:replicative DNA helicase